MHAFVIGFDVPAHRAEHLLACLGPSATATTAGPATIVHTPGDAPALRIERRGDRVDVAFGSGLRLGGTPSGGGLLDGADDDLVAAVATHDTVTVAGGRGDHRLYRVAPDGGGVIVGTNLGAVARALGPGLSVDRRAEDFALGFGFHPPPSTVYDGIEVLPRGTRLVVRRSAEHRETVAAPAVGTSAGPTSFDDAVDELRGLLLGAVERQAGPDRHHAVLLGGFDSALVAACLRRLGHEVHTYTFGFGDPRYEQRGAQALADEIGAIHHVVPIEADEVMDGLRRFRDLYPSIGAQPHYQIHTLIGARRIAADGHDHVFTGDACDSIFLGYPTVSARAGLTARLGRIPRPVARATRAVLGRDLVAHRLGHVARMARGVLGNLDLEMPARGHLPTPYLDEHELRRLRRDHPPPQAEPIDAVREQLAAPVGHLDPVRIAFHGNGLNGQSAAKVDGAVAATGVAQHSPYRDLALREWVARLPTEYLRPVGGAARDAGKAVLVEMALRHGLLPAAIAELPKQSPSDSPIDDWYAGRLRGDVHDLVTHLPFELDRDELDQVLRPKWAEHLYRERISISHHALQVVGLLCSYASFGELAGW